MNDANVVVLRGRVTSEPRVTELPSGSTVTAVEVTTRADGTTASTPVAVFDRPVAVREGDEVLAFGHVRRRFFRAGATTQSRTEVVAHTVVRVTRRRAAERAFSRAAAHLCAMADLDEEVPVS